MAPFTFISDRVGQAEATVDAGRLLVDGATLEAAIGWTLKPEGLCQGDTCVPVAEARNLWVDERIDVAAVAGALGRSIVIDEAAAIAALALDTEARRQALSTLRAPSFTLDDLDGHPHRLEEWAGRKKLLLAFSSW